MRTINKISAAYVLCWTFFPFMQVGTQYRVLAIIFAVIWGITAISIDVSFISKYQVFFLFVCLTSIGMIFCRIMLGLSVSTAVAGSLQFVIMMIAGMMAIFYFLNDFSYIEKLFPFLLIALIIFSFTTMQGIFDNPYAARIANSEWLENRFEGNEMVGLYGYIYMCVFIQPMLLQLRLKRIHLGKFTDVLIRIVFIENFIMIMVSGYMIAIFCMLGSCLLLWILNQRSVVMKFLIVILFVLFVFYYQNIIEGIFSFLIGRLSNNPVYAQKLIDFQQLFLYGDFTGYTVEGRFSNYYHSLQTILEFPVFGSYFSGVPGGGGHSSFLDVFGKFGLLIGLMYSYLVLKVPHRIGCRTKRWEALDYILLLLMLIFGLADPFFQEMGIAVFFVFPYVISLGYINEEYVYTGEN